MARDELLREIEQLRSRAERAEAALERLHGERDEAPWCDGVPAEPLDVDCPYHELIDSLNAPVVFLDPDGYFQYANKCAAELVGIPQEEMVGVDARELLPDRDRNGHDQSSVVDELLADPEDLLQQTTEIELADGSRRVMEWSRRPIRDRAGDLMGVVSIGHDVTEEHDARESILRYQQSLRSLTSELALSEERQRRSMATRIHEEIGQNLAYAKLRIGELANGGEDCGDAVEELRGLLDQAIAGTRALTFELSPPMLHELGFSEAVEWLTEQFTERHGIECCFSDGARDRSLPNDVSVTLFRAVAELLHNVAQHADASSVRVSVNTNNGDIQVRVCDDGRGFNAKEAMQYRQPEDGFGLFSIDERVDYLGGSMEVRSDSLTGTCVILTAPTDGRERS